MSLKSEILQYQNKLDRIISKIENSKSLEPEGDIIIKKASNTRNEYYFTTETSRRKMKYIHNGDTDVIAALLQKRYDRIILCRAKEQQLATKRFVKKLDEFALQNVYSSFDSISQSYIKAYLYPDEVIASLWKNKPYEPNPYPFASRDIVTLNNEIVRSKSEAIIADCLRDANIPYKYECPLCVSGYKTIYPDFTIFDKKTGKEFYWEHCGKMDSDDYRTKFYRKLDMYAGIGVFPGKRLILTFEEYKVGLNTNYVKAIIGAFFNEL